MAETVVLARPEQLSEAGQAALRGLLRAWFEFERRLSRVPIIQRLETGTFTREDYLQLLLNLRQQVIEGSRWISRCASSFDRDHADIRSVILGHAHDEHRDYEVLEQDYVAAGGDLAAIRARARNPGSEALHGYMMYRASEPNPVGLLGAMWIVEGLGEKMAKRLGGAHRGTAGCGRGRHPLPALSRPERRRITSASSTPCSTGCAPASRLPRHPAHGGRGRPAVCAAAGGRSMSTDPRQAAHSAYLQAIAVDNSCPSARLPSTCGCAICDNPLRWIVRPVLQFVFAVLLHTDLGAQATAAAAVPRAWPAAVDDLRLLPQLRHAGSQPAHPAAFRDRIEPAEFPARQQRWRQREAAGAVSAAGGRHAAHDLRRSRPGTVPHDA